MRTVAMKSLQASLPVASFKKRLTQTTQTTQHHLQLRPPPPQPSSLGGNATGTTVYHHGPADMTQLCASSIQLSHRLEFCFEGLQGDFMDDTQGVSQLKVQGLNAVRVIGGATAPVAGAHEAPHAGAGVQDMPDVLLRAVCTAKANGSEQGSGSVAEGSCRDPMGVMQHSRGVK